MFDFFKVQKVTSKSKKLVLAKDFENIPAISKYFKETTGIDFDDQAVVFKSKVISFCRTHEVSSFKECLESMDTNKQLRQELTDYLTTNESFFYRELHQIKDLVKQVQSSSKSVKILCAPSANGEEPYSIAIALMSEGILGTRFQITGIDISADAIIRAKEAVYNEKAIRNLSEELRAKYFRKETDKYYLNSEVKRQVTFKCINIFDDAFKNIDKFDYIFSRNMLIYFDTKTRIKAQNLFKEHLLDTSKEIYYGHADLTHEHI